MIEIFKHYAKSNNVINGMVITIIEEQKEDVYNKNVEGFFKSIGGIFDHIYKADLLWLSSFKTVREFEILKDPIFSNLPGYTDRVFENLAEFKKGREKVDSLFMSLAEEIRPDDLNGVVSRVTRSGEKQEKIFWKALVHVFNHQTHHRGQISQILDELKIENDFSNMIRIE